MMNGVIKQILCNPDGTIDYVFDNYKLDEILSEYLSKVTKRYIPIYLKKDGRVIKVYKYCTVIKIKAENVLKT